MSDGPDFNYHANVVKFVTVRLILARRRAGCIIAIIDVSTAFLQSHPYPAGKVKYISFKNPLTGKWVYFRQSGPIYGEASAHLTYLHTHAAESNALSVATTIPLNLAEPTARLFITR